MIVYMDLENLLKEKNISKNKLCEACNLQRTQLNNYCKNKVSRIDFTILAKLCEFLDCTPNDILKLKYRDCVICFSQIYDRELPQRRIRDYDNLEFKQILDTLCTYVLTDDSGFFCDSYYTTQLGLKDCTLVSVMEKADFPKWLQNQKNHHESMSENLLTSQAEIRHR